MASIKIAIIEKKDQFLTATLQKLDRENLVEIVTEVENIESLMGEIKPKTIDVLIIGLILSCGYHAIKDLCMVHPNIKLIIYSHFDGVQNIIEMGRLGAKSFIAKHKYSDLLRAIKIVHEGGFFLPDEFSFIMRKHLTVCETIPGSIDLSKTERFLLTSICRGMSSSQIANEMFKSPRTIEKYRQDLYNKFGVDGKEQLIIRAFRLSLLT